MTVEEGGSKIVSGGETKRKAEDGQREGADRTRIGL